MNAQDLTSKYSQRVREILDWYHQVVDAAKEQRRQSLEALEDCFTEAYDGLKESKE